MYSYALLEAGCHYLIQEEEDSLISLVKINVESDHCVFISRYTNEEELEWKRKTDPIHDIIELLSDDKVSQWQEAYNSTFNFKSEDDDYE
jgi:quinol monooxygenase YgiN